MTFQRGRWKNPDSCVYTLPQALLTLVKDALVKILCANLLYLVSLANFSLKCTCLVTWQDYKWHTVCFLLRFFAVWGHGDLSILLLYFHAKQRFTKKWIWRQTLIIKISKIYGQICYLWKIHSCLLAPNCTRNHVITFILIRHSDRTKLVYFNFFRFAYTNMVKCGPSKNQSKRSDFLAI